MTENKRPELGELKVGQEVMVRRSPNDMRGRRPASERYIPAVITKVARVWIEIERTCGDREKLPSWSIYRWRMRQDSQDEGTQFTGSNASFATLEQHAWDQTRNWAFEVLSENGIRLDMDSPWRDREVELADLITGGRKA
jgi:hypothetical protein